MFGKVLLSVSLLAIPTSSPTSYPYEPCRYLVHIGDSTSISIAKKLKAKYEYVGFKNVYVSVGNGRSLVYSQKPDKMSGINVIKYYKRKLGSNICWVIALGTNDAASSQQPSDSRRIDLTMEAIDGDRVVWVNVWMNSKTRPNYNAKAAQQWNSLLSKKLEIYSRAYVMNWAVLGKGFPSWMAPDGYHYSSIGYKKRSELIPITVAFLLQ